MKEENMAAQLQTAALELFEERGYAETTAAEIAARAGVTERTFFRYFADKREVLFKDGGAMEARLVAEIATAPAALGPLAALFRAFETLAPEFERNFLLMASRLRVITASPALREREGAKRAALAIALATALQKRGVARLPATLAAEAAIAGLTQSTLAWLENSSIGHAEHLKLVLRELRTTLDT